MVNSKYITLVFRNETNEEIQANRKMSKQEHCRAWSLDHEPRRLDLIRDALEENDIEKAKSLSGVDGVDLLEA